MENGPIRAIFWDNDGVLVDTEHLYFQASREALATVGIELTEEDFIRISLRQGESVFLLAADGGATPSQVEGLREARNRRYSELLATEARPIEGVEETLRALHGRLAMAIVTSSLDHHFQIIHRGMGLLPFFDFVLTREAYPLSKPHPDPYRMALARTGLPPEACLVVEDSERGLQASIAAGLRCLVIPSGLTRRGTFPGALAVLQSVREVPAVLANL